MTERLLLSSLILVLLAFGCSTRQAAEGSGQKAVQKQESGAASQEPDESEQ